MENTMEKLNTIGKIKAFREAGDVERCHNMRHIGEYTVASHSYGVASLLVCLWPLEHDQKLPSSELLAAALTHDLPERWTGDIPYPAKQLYKRLDESSKALETLITGHTDTIIQISKEEKLWLKSCDMLELYLWANNQAFVLGNLGATQLVKVAYSVLLNNPKVPQAIKTVVETWDNERLDDFCYPGAMQEMNDD